MSLKCGIVGLPNVGKSTLFNALSSAKAEAANYPFCTIEPNVGMVDVPDPSLKKISDIFQSEKLVHASTQFVDIAGLVKGASQGEGLGNQFLSHIREVDAIIHLVRCFAIEDVVHVHGQVDPRADVEVIDTELLLADLQTVEKRWTREKNLSKSGMSDAVERFEFIDKLKTHLDAGKPARSFPKKNEDEEHTMQELCLLTEKPVLFVANTRGEEEEKAWVEEVKKISEENGAKYITIDCGLEAEIAALPEDERGEFLTEMGLEEPGLHRLIRAGFDLMGLFTFYTAGPKETHAWTLGKGKTAPQAAGVIHTDFEKGFIKADCYQAEDLFAHGTEAKLREAGLIRQEGKEYVVKPGDVLFFRFNV